MVNLVNKGKGKILFIVEGEKTEVKLMKRLLDQYGIAEQYQIFSYNTNIYALYNAMFRDTDPAEWDIQAHLKSRENNPEKKVILDQRFSDILLIFDFDPHDPDFSEDRIIKMAEYFVESTDMGKLYLNYPMVEAFCDMKSIPDDDYNSYTASLKELKSKTYKERVYNKNPNCGQLKFEIDKLKMDIVIRQNLEKSWFILGTQEPPAQTKNFVPKLVDILYEQLRKLRAECCVAVLCTCVLYIVDYNPKLLD